MYAKLEEEHGLARHAMSVYERATNAVLPEERFEVKNITIYMYLNKSIISLNTCSKFHPKWLLDII